MHLNSPHPNSVPCAAAVCATLDTAVTLANGRRAHVYPSIPLETLDGTVSRSDLDGLVPHMAVNLRFHIANHGEFSRWLSIEQAREIGECLLLQAAALEGGAL